MKRPCYPGIAAEVLILFCLISAACFPFSLPVGTAAEARRPSFKTSATGDWVQVGGGGIDGGYQLPVRGVLALAEYDGALYAGTSSCEVWRWDGNAWGPVSQAGFGDDSNHYITSLAVYGGRLYAGTSNPSSGGQVWSWDGTSWSKVADGGLGDPGNVEIEGMAVFGDLLFLGTQNDEGCQIWRWDGSAWEQMVGQDPPGTPGTGPGFGDADNTIAISLEAYGSMLYVGTENHNGCQVWSYGEGFWSPLTEDGFGNPSNKNVASMSLYSGKLYMGTAGEYGYEVWSWDGSSLAKEGEGFGGGAVSMLAHGGSLFTGIFNSEIGCRVFAYDGSGWVELNEPGFGEPTNWDPAGMAEHADELFVSTASPLYGAEVWRFEDPGWSKINRTGFVENASFEASSLAFHQGLLHAGTLQGNGCAVWRRFGNSWEKINEDGFGDGYNKSASSMASLGSRICVGKENYCKGCQVWRWDGAAWEKISEGGFGDPNNVEASSMAAYGGMLYVGTNNITIYGTSEGCQVWRWDGNAWEQVSSGGFGSNANFAASSLQTCGPCLYAGTWNNSGCQVWRWDSAAWNSSSPPEMGSGGNTIVASMAAATSADEELLYAGIGNEKNGCQVWRLDAEGWTRVADGGFDGPDNTGAMSMASYGQEVYAGTMNFSRGCQVWGLEPARTWYLAEGCTRGGMETFVLVQNPGSESATVDLVLHTSDGEMRPPALQGQVIPAGSRRTWRLNDYLATWEVSTLVRADAVVVAERAVYGSGRTWAHESVGVNAPAERWLLAEGCTRGGFDTFLLVQNPLERDLQVDVAFQTEYGRAEHPALQGLWIPARSRRSIHLNDFVYSWNVSTEVTATGPVVCERAMYGEGGAWAHDSRGVSQPHDAWHFAEGCTAGGMETYVLVQNPGDEPAHLRLTFMTSRGETAGPVTELSPQSRITFRVNDHVSDWDVSTLVESDVPVVCERAMYGPGWTWAHESVGAAATSFTWYLAEGCTEGGMETYLLVQNPGEEEAVIDVVLQTGSGEVRPPGLQGQAVPPRSRRTFRLNDFISDWDVSAAVYSNEPVVCERAMYGSGRAWAHCSVAYSP